MKKSYLLFAAFLFCLSISSCKKDEGGGCITCSSTETTDFQVCENSDGNAVVNGENTGTPYDVYIAGLEEAGANCGG
jgi:hypothetical protein